MPNHFRLPDEYVERYLAAPRRGNLVTVHADGPRATLVPLFAEERDEGRVRVGHLVRNNPQAREPVTGPALAIIDIADAYVSPSWYTTNDELPNVPTWDYVTIHATGELRVDPSPEAALRAASALTVGMGEGDVLDRVGTAKLERMARAIVGVELRVERLEAKAKMSQNRHPDDVASLLTAFERQGLDEVAQSLREVSLPYARQRFATIREARATHELRVNPAQ